jgi:hypothetical protein
VTPEDPASAPCLLIRDGAAPISAAAFQQSEIYKQYFVNLSFPADLGTEARQK